MFIRAGQPTLLRCDAVRGGGAREGVMALALLSARFRSPATHKRIGPFWCWFLGRWVCVHSRTLWVSPANSPVSLGVSPASASIPTGVFNWWFEALFPCAGALACRSVLLPSCASRFICTRTWDHRLYNPPPCCVHQPPPFCESSLPLLPVWRNVSSLTPWFSDFHTVRFSVSSGCFLNSCCPSFGCARRHSVSAYASILASSLKQEILKIINTLNPQARLIF